MPPAAQALTDPSALHPCDEPHRRNSDAPLGRCKDELTLPADLEPGRSWPGSPSPTPTLPSRRPTRVVHDNDTAAIERSPERLPRSSAMPGRTPSNDTSRPAESVRVTDVPVDRPGRAYLVERGLEEDGYAALLASA